MGGAVSEIQTSERQCNMSSQQKHTNAKVVQAYRELGYDRPTAQKIARIARDKKRSGEKGRS